MRSNGPIAPCEIVAVGEGPGEDEDRTGVGFVGRSGQFLQKALLEHAELVLGRTIVSLNAVSCRPPGNRNPEPEELEACLPWLILNLWDINPKFVLLVGDIAASVFLTEVKPGRRGVFVLSDIVKETWRQLLPQARFFHIYHPSYIQRQHRNDKRERWFEDVARFGLGCRVLPPMEA